MGRKFDDTAVGKSAPAHKSAPTKNVQRRDGKDAARPLLASI